MSEYITFASNHPYLFIALFVVLALIIKTEIESRVSGVAQTGPMEAVRLMDEDGMLSGCPRNLGIQLGSFASGCAYSGIGTQITPE